MKLTWVVAGHGAGETSADTLEEAVGHLQGGLREVGVGLDQEVAARLLYSHWGPLRMALLTDGATAVNAGESWSSTSGGITVNVYP
ncbi:hypothetical protein [Streptomyces ardesiacus]|uniref:hypothetical protein n=1 Tax=Streptomyces ardesiacus TaxID=285564 RepID=UPI00131F350D|nr:hypothetical protein [Streptomyces ardesiacus]